MENKNKIIVDNSKNLHKSFTVILGIIVTLLSFLELNQELVTQILGTVLSQEQFSMVTGFLGLLIVIGRYIKQPKL